MNASSSIFLVGPMGAGKSAVGRQLARLLNMEFVDTDEEIENRTGVDIPFIFEKEGEQGFRDRESRVVDEMSQQQGVVLATGGGVVMREENRRCLKARGLVVYLKTSVEQQWQRTSKGRHRPLLHHEDPKAVLAELTDKRAPLYEELADLTVDTDGRKVGSVAAEIARHVDKE